MAQRSIKSRLNLVRDAQKEQDTLCSLPKIQANLELLEDILNLTQRDLDTICQQVIDGELKEANLTTLMTEVTALIDSSCETVTQL